MPTIGQLNRGNNVVKKVYSYDPALITLQLAGVFLTGYAEDSKVEIEQNEDDIIPKAGVDGDQTFTTNNNKSATITVTLNSASPMVNFVTDLARAHQPFPIVISDMNDNGRSFGTDDCAILKTPNYIRHKEAEEVKFEIYVPFWEW